MGGPMGPTSPKETLAPKPAPERPAGTSDRPGGRVNAARLLSLIVCVALLGQMACGGSAAEVGGTGASGSVRGAVADVKSASLTRLSSIDVKDENGTGWHFEAGDDYKGLSPSHLREHMLQGLPVTVVYHEENAALIIDDVTD